MLFVERKILTASPLSRQKRLDGLAAFEKLRVIAPAAVFRIGQRYKRGIARVPRKAPSSPALQKFPIAVRLDAMAHTPDCCLAGDPDMTGESIQIVDLFVEFFDVRVTFGGWFFLA
jgi:hypothetical protein